MMRGPATFRAQVAVLAVCALAVPAQLYLAIPLRPHLAQTLGAAPAAWASSAFSLAYAIGFLVFGPISDRVGRRRVLVGGLAGLAAATAAVSMAPGPGLFLAFRAAQGLAAASFAPVALVWVTEKAPPARRAAALTVVTTALLGAGLAGQLYGTATLALVDWRRMFLLAVLPYAVVALLLHRALEADTPRSPVSLRAVYRPLTRLVREAPTMAVFLAALTVFGSFVGLYVTLDRHLVGVERFTPHGVLAAEAVGCLGLLAAPALHWVLRTSMGPRTQTLLGFVVAAIGITAAQLTVGWLVPVLGSMVYVAGIGLVVPGLVDLLARHAPHARGVAVAFNTFMLFAGASVAPFVVDQLSYPAALAVLAAALLAAAALVMAGVSARPPGSLRPDRSVGVG